MKALLFYTMMLHQTTALQNACSTTKEAGSEDTTQEGLILCQSSASTTKNPAQDPSTLTRMRVSLFHHFVNPLLHEASVFELLLVGQAVGDPLRSAAAKSNQSRHTPHAIFNANIVHGTPTGATSIVTFRGIELDFCESDGAEFVAD